MTKNTNNIGSLTPRMIEIGEIEALPFQARKTIGDLSELAASINSDGLLQVPIVRPVKGRAPYRYQMVAGERRWRAMESLGYAQIPAIVRELSDLEARRINLAENIERANLTDLEDAQAVFDYWATIEEIEGFKLSQNEFLRRMNRGAQWITDRKNLLAIGDDLKPIAAAHMGVTAQMLLINKERGELREHLISLFDAKGKKRASVRQVKAIIAEWQEKERQAKAAQTTKAPDAHTQSRNAYAASTSGTGHSSGGSAPVGRGGEQITDDNDEKTAQNALDIVLDRLLTEAQAAAHAWEDWQPHGAKMRLEILEAVAEQLAVMGYEVVQGELVER